MFSFVYFKLIVNTQMVKHGIIALVYFNSYDQEYLKYTVIDIFYISLQIICIL